MFIFTAVTSIQGRNMYAESCLFFYRMIKYYGNDVFLILQLLRYIDLIDLHSFSGFSWGLSLYTSAQLLEKKNAWVFKNQRVMLNLFIFNILLSPFSVLGTVTSLLEWYLCLLLNQYLVLVWMCRPLQNKILFLTNFSEVCVSGQFNCILMFSLISAI